MFKGVQSSKFQCGFHRKANNYQGDGKDGNCGKAGVYPVGQHITVLDNHGKCWCLMVESVFQFCYTIFSLVVWVKPTSQPGFHVHSCIKVFTGKKILQ